MKNITAIDKFKEQSTWRLLGLGVVTFGVYFAHYIKKQTNKMNAMLDENDQISDGFISVVLIISYISLVFLVAYFFLEEDHVIAKVSNLLDRVWGVMFLVWGFKARNRMNQIFEISKADYEWFDGLWTFFFSPLYFNYKVNKIYAIHVDNYQPKFEDH